MAGHIDTWLDTATRGLCDDAKARIGAEVRAHINDGIEHLRAEGVPEHEALLKPVEDLGNPKQARRNFTRLYLTRREAYDISRTVEFYKRNELWVLRGYFVILSMIILSVLWNIVGMPMNISTVGLAAFLSLLPWCAIEMLSRYLVKQEHSKVFLLPTWLPVLGLLCMFILPAGSIYRDLRRDDSFSACIHQHNIDATMMSDKSLASFQRECLHTTPKLRVLHLICLACSIVGAIVLVSRGLRLARKLRLAESQTAAEKPPPGGL